MKIAKEQTPYNAVVRKADANFLSKRMLLMSKFPNTKFLNASEIYKELLNNNLTYIEALFVITSTDYDNVEEAPLHFLHWAFDIEGSFKLHVLNLLLPENQYKILENQYSQSFDNYQNASDKHREQMMIEYEKINIAVNELFFKFFIKNKTLTTNEAFMGKELLVSKEALEHFFKADMKDELDQVNVPYTMSEDLLQYNLAVLRVMDFTETVSMLCDSNNEVLTPTFNRFLEFSKTLNLEGDEQAAAKKIHELVLDDVAKNSFQAKRNRLRKC